MSELAAPPPKNIEPGEWAITLDAGPSNDESAEVGYTIRIWRNHNLILSSGSQAYVSEDYAELLISDLIRPSTPVVLHRRNLEHDVTSAERLR